MRILQIQTFVINLLLLYLTSTSALPPQLNKDDVNVSKSNIIKDSNVSNIPVEGGGKLTRTTNVTIIPGPNLDLDKVADFKPQPSPTVNMQPSLKSKEVMLSEGGGKSSVNDSANKSNFSFPNNNHKPREGDYLTPLATSNNVTSLNKSLTHIAMEGGGKPEQIKGPEITVPKISDVPTSNPATPQRTIPVSEVDESSRQKIAPRKGVNNLEYSEFKKSETSTPIPIIKKPLFTEASEDEPPVSIQHDINSETNMTELKPKVPSLDRFNEFSNNTQQYVIPIVIVILSVPLVTIVISFLLKRGAEWWKYRHYRRMDLINGIYDT